MEKTNTITILYGFARFNLSIPGPLSLWNLVAVQLERPIMFESGDRFGFYKITDMEISENNRLLPESVVEPGDSIAVVDFTRTFWQLYLIYPCGKVELSRFFEGGVVEFLIEDAFRFGAIWVEKLRTYTPLLRDSGLSVSYQWKYKMRKPRIIQRKIKDRNLY